MQDDLILVDEGMESLQKKVLMWKEQLEGKGIRLNQKMTDVIVRKKMW